MSATMPSEPSKRVVPIHKAVQTNGPKTPTVRYPQVTGKAKPVK